jgi:C4-dicarboxylate transporter DctQ subunit
MKKAFELFTRAHDSITVFGYYFSCLALAVIFSSYIVEVFGRYFFNAPQWWASEAVSYSLCAGAFMMMPYVTWKKGHVAVALIFDVLPKRLVRPAVWITYLMGALACGFAAWITFDETLRQYYNDVHIMAVKPVPKYLISIVLPFGFASSTIHFIRMLDWRMINPETAGSLGGFVED